jgi:transcriptional regulator with XRE-family HTH domain
MKDKASAPSITSFAEKFRGMRMESCMSLRQMARASGTSPTFLTDIEHGRRLPSKEVLIKLAECMRRPASELLKCDPRENLDRIVAKVNEHPEIGQMIADLCDRYSDGKISWRDLKSKVG